MVKKVGKKRRGNPLIAEYGKKTQITVENAVEMQERGAKAKHHNKTMRNAFKAKLEELMMFKGREMTGAEILAEENFDRALKDGYFSAFFRDTAGEAPAQRVEHITPPTIIDDVKGGN